MSKTNPHRLSQSLQAGTLDVRVSLQRRTSGKDALGQPVDSWTEYAKVWGDVRQLSGRETVSSTSVDTGNASIRIRYRTDVTHADRAVAQGIVFNVASVLPNVKSREYTDLVVTQNANEG